MVERSMIIIGGGLAGLSTGCYARMNGWRTRIFEHHDVPGGVCTAWKRKGYLIDGCIHWLMSIKPGEPMRRIYDELGVGHPDRFLPLTRYALMVDEATGARVDFAWDLDRVEADMARVAPGDREAIREFTDGVRALRGFPMEVLAPRELVGLREGLRMLWSMRSGLLPMWRYGMSVAEFARRFSSPVLRRFVEHVFVPEMPAMFAMVVLAQLADGRLGGYRGGSLAFARAVERRYAGLGGEIACRSRVAKVLVENDRAVGVRLADGTEHHADVVVSAADGRSTIFDLLGGKYVDSAIRDRYARWPLFRPLVQASWGVADPLADREHSGAIFLGEPIRYGPLSCAGFHYRICNYDPSLAPPGKTVVQVLMETEWDWWAKLREDKAAYAAEKERLAAALFDRLSRHLPAAAGKVDVTDVATPYTFWRYTLNQRGAYEGWLPTVEATKASVARTLPGLGSFHMVGQWVTPGGGVPPALFIGRHLLQELCRAERRPFTASVP